MFRLFFGITILLLFISCSEENLPKPKAFLKLEYGEKVYRELTVSRPYSFEVSNKIILKDMPKKWLKIEYPSLKATVDIMTAKSKNVKIRSSYNLAAISFTPQEVAASIKKHIPEFKITYAPDYRQDIASTWPKSINDSYAREDWKWKYAFSLEDITEEMLFQLGKKYNTISKASQ